MKQYFLIERMMDKDGNLYGSLSIPGNQRGHRIAFIVRLENEEQKTISQEQVFAAQVVSTDSPYKKKIKTFKRQLLAAGGRMLGA